ncbi:NAD(P)-dependent oxidoreductase [Vibrio lentus]|nr:NAD(P)-dependent oxidoreductase [Vibrio lentus]
MFNAPFSNTRSVAELVLGQVLLLLRGIPERTLSCSPWHLEKECRQLSYEARGKRLGIIGYGHIGTQLGIIAENLGMRVYFCDIENKLSWVTQLKSIQYDPDLLNKYDVISLHVPETNETKNMMGKKRVRPHEARFYLHQCRTWHCC